MTPARGAARRADRPLGAGDVRLARRAGDGPRGRHDRLGALRRRRPGLLALVQVPPPARPPVLLRPVPQLPRPDRRRAGRARLHDAGRRRACRSTRSTPGRRSRPTRLHAVGRATPSFGMQVGFYYKTFIRPRWAWKYYEKFLRSAAGLGKLDPEHRRTGRFEKVHRHVDVLVIGGGESGLEAAIAAARDGRETALVDEGLALGGRLAFSGIAAAARAADLASQAARGRRRDPEPRLGRRRLRGEPRPRLPGQHDVPVPRRRDRGRDGRDRAAARVRPKRPARRHARLRRPPAREPVSDRARRAGRRRHRRRPRHRRGLRPGRGRHGGGRRRRPARRGRGRAPGDVRDRASDRASRPSRPAAATR